MRLSSPAFVFAALVSLASADVKFTIPAAGALLPGTAASTVFTVTWIDSGAAPTLVDLTGYTLFLFSGSNAAPSQLYQLAASTFAAGSTVSVTVPTGIGAATPNAYFLGMLSVARAGGTVWNYSNRFSLPSMTGTFSAAVITALQGVSGTAGPPTKNSVANVQAPVAGNPTAPAVGEFATPYNLQTGLTKYAPMQPVPPTAITATNTAPLWPTSAVQFASTFLPLPTVLTTLTQAGTFSVLSHPNTGAPASMPTNDMQRFLNRWKD